MIGEIIGGLTTGYSMISGLTNRPKVDRNAQMADQMIGQINLQENYWRQVQMNLDANRRKRDILRNAQVASAGSEAVASLQGAGNSSFASGATSAISGQAGVNYLGVSQNQEIGNTLFALENQKGILEMVSNNARQKAQERNLNSDMMNKIVAGITGNEEKLTKLGEFASQKWGTGLFSNISMM